MRKQMGRGHYLAIQQSRPSGTVLLDIESIQLILLSAGAVVLQ
jgi:hypothetical protein